MNDGWIELNQPFGEAATPDMVLQSVIELLGDLLTTNSIPVDYGWDWAPFLTALCEQSITIQSPDRIYIRPGVTIPKDLNQSPGGNTTGIASFSGGHRIDQNTIDRSKTIPRRIDSQGAFDYVWYVPEWTHPDYDPSVTVTYNKPPAYRYGRDPLSNLRPALRAPDLARGPTKWAKRFGIHPEELGGRSRLSPTLSKTRDPFQDYANQINMLSDEGRKMAIEASRDAARRAGAGGDYIAPEVLEDLMMKDGTLSAKQLQEELENNLGAEGKRVTLDLFVESLNARGPVIFNAHSSFLTNALADQDWQRLLFRDLTSDELVWENILTMSDNAKCDLADEIHPLFQRNRWRDFGHKGAVRYVPRVLYNLNGERKEWNVATNDELWEALQPALRLVSKIINSRHPALLRLVDMTNRRRLPEHMDNRQTDYPDRPRGVPAYGAPENGQVGERYEQLVRLQELGYNWEDNIYRILGNFLHFDVHSGYLSPSRSNDPKAVDGCFEWEDCTYGCTNWYDVGDHVYQTIYLSAEIIWPLLMPQYSQTEKMVASFGVASTLLHEFGHALVQAVQILTKMPSMARRPGQSDEVTQLLLSLPGELWDSSLTSEPVLMGHGGAECGFDLEMAVFGGVGLNFLNNNSLYHSRQLKTVPLILGSTPWPMRFDPPPLGMARGSAVLDAPYPVEDYITPVTADWISQFFSQKWWDQTHAAYGHEALKLRPTNRLLKCSMTPQWIDQQHLINAYGENEAKFLRLAIALFGQNGHTIAGDYIKSMAEQPIMPSIATGRWGHEILNWYSEEISPLQKSVTEMTAVMQNAIRVNDTYRDVKKDPAGYYQLYVQAYKDGRQPGKPDGPFTPDQFMNNVGDAWARVVKGGGILMRAVLATYNNMIRDIQHLQRMVLDYFSLNPQARGLAHSGGAGQDLGYLGQAYQRMENFRGVANGISNALNSLANVPELVALKPHWSRWARSYDRCSALYGDLLSMLGDESQFNPSDPNFRKRLASIPSSYWANRMDRLRILMQKVYVKMDPRLRALVDECETIVRRYPGSAGMMPPLDKDETDVAQVVKVMEKMKNLGQELPANVPGPFNWKPPPVPTTRPQPPQQSQPSQQKQPSQQSQSSAPPPPPPPPSQQNPFEFQRVVFGAANPIEMPPPVRAPFRNVPPNPFQNTRTESPFRELEGGQASSFGPGGQIASSDPGQTAFRPRPPDSREFRAPMFRSPYASSTTVTEDVDAYEEDVNMARAVTRLMDMQSGVVHGPYTTDALYREVQSQPDSPPPLSPPSLPLPLPSMLEALQAPTPAYTPDDPGEEDQAMQDAPPPADEFSLGDMPAEWFAPDAPMHESDFDALMEMMEPEYLNQNSQGDQGDPYNHDQYNQDNQDTQMQG
ncbi:hypothetical protein F4818DRAFT_388587 [Hypoxylon cercidicola]|nr:hypothetical protein F4818DRAFT_388587 [Hypoxylon cercidicola]